MGGGGEVAGMRLTNQYVQILKLYGLLPDVIRGRPSYRFIRTEFVKWRPNALLLGLEAYFGRN